MKVLAATTAEWTTIESLRRHWCEQLGAQIVPRDDATFWRVVHDDVGEVCGAFSYTEPEGYGQRWIQDFYVSPDARAARAAVAMWEDLLAQKAVDGLPLVCTVHPYNFGLLRHMHRRGFAPVTLTMMLP